MNCESTGKKLDDWVRERVRASERVQEDSPTSAICSEMVLYLKQEQLLPNTSRSQCHQRWSNWSAMVKMAWMNYSFLLEEKSSISSLVNPDRWGFVVVSGCQGTNDKEIPTRYKRMCDEPLVMTTGYCCICICLLRKLFGKQNAPRERATGCPRGTKTTVFHFTCLITSGLGRTGSLQSLIP